MKNYRSISYYIFVAIAMLCFWHPAFAEDSEALTVNEAGNVGIGTTSPTGKLQVQGKIRLGSNLFNPWNEKNTELGIYFQSKGANTDAPNMLHTAGRIYGENFNPGWDGQALVLEAGKDWESSDIPFAGNQLVLRANGNIGIGTGSPSKRLDISGGSIKVDGSLGTHGFDPDAGYPAGWGGGIHTWDIFAEGTIAAGYSRKTNAFMNRDGIVSAYQYLTVSDAYLKENIKPIKEALEKVSKLRGVYYYWMEKSHGKQRQVGVIAQEVQQVLPEVVHIDNQGHESVEYAKLVALLIEAIKELKNEKDQLKEELDKAVGQLVAENKILKQENLAMLHSMHDTLFRLQTLEKIDR